MPSLNPNAKCPKCGEPILALTDLTSSLGVVREFFHKRRPQKRGIHWRKGPCVKTYTSTQREQAHLEREMLECASVGDKIQ